MPFSILDLVGGGLVFAGALAYNHAIEKTLHKVLPNRDKTNDHHGIPWWAIELIHVIVITLLIIAFFYFTGDYNVGTAFIKSSDTKSVVAGAAAGGAAGTAAAVGVEGMMHMGYTTSLPRGTGPWSVPYAY